MQSHRHDSNNNKGTNFRAADAPLNNADPQQPVHQPPQLYRNATRGTTINSKPAWKYVLGGPKRRLSGMAGTERDSSLLNYESEGIYDRYGASGGGRDLELGEEIAFTSDEDLDGDRAVGMDRAMNRSDEETNVFKEADDTTTWRDEEKLQQTAAGETSLLYSGEYGTSLPQEQEEKLPPALSQDGLQAHHSGSSAPLHLTRDESAEKLQDTRPQSASKEAENLSDLHHDTNENDASLKAGKSATEMEHTTDDSHASATVTESKKRRSPSPSNKKPRKIKPSASQRFISSSENKRPSPPKRSSSSPSNISRSPIHSRTTIATRMKQQLSRNALVKQPSTSKLYRYQQMRETIQKAIEEHRLVASLPSEASPANGDSTPPYIKQVNLSMYSDENLSRRERLRSEEKIQEQLNYWWKRTKKEKHPMTDDEFITRKTYVSLSMAIFYVLMMMDSNSTREIPLKQSSSVAASQQPVTLMDARKCAEQDWINDAKGASVLSKDAFLDSVYDLADLWCESIRVSEYVEFLERLGKRVFEDSTLPLIMRRHVKREAPKRRSAGSLQTPSKKKKKRKRKKRKPLPKIDWKKVKQAGMDQDGDSGSYSTSPEKTPRDEYNFAMYQERHPSPLRTDESLQHTVTEPFHQEAPVETTSAEDKESIISEARHSSPNSVDESNQSTLSESSVASSNKNFDIQGMSTGPPSRPISVTKRRTRTPTRQPRPIQLSPSELQEILQYLRNKDALKLIMALLKQGDQYILEKTIFDRLLKKLQSGYETNLSSSLFAFMNQRIIPDRYQSIMSRLNKLNPEQFVTVLRDAMDTRKNQQDQIVLDLTDVAPSYKRNISRPVSPASSKIGIGMPRREAALTKRLLRTVSAKADQRRGASSVSPSLLLTQSFSRPPSRSMTPNYSRSSKSRPISAPMNSTSASEKWNSWKSMVLTGMEISKNYDSQSEDSSEAYTEDYNEVEHHLQDDAEQPEEQELENQSTVVSVPEKDEPDLNDSQQRRDSDDFSMFSDLSSATEEMSDLWSQSEVSSVHNDAASMTMKESPSTHNIDQSEQVATPKKKKIREFRVRNVERIRSAYNTPKRSTLTSSSLKRSSWIPVGRKKSSSRNTATIEQTSSSYYEQQVENQNVHTAAGPMETETFQKPAPLFLSEQQSPLQYEESVVFLKDMNQPRYSREEDAITGNLESARSVKAADGSTSAPTSRPTSAGIRVRIKRRPNSSTTRTSGSGKNSLSHRSSHSSISRRSRDSFAGNSSRPSSASSSKSSRKRPLSASNTPNFSHLSHAEIVYDSSIGSPSSRRIRRP